MINHILEFDQFIRSVNISKQEPFSFFLGAGASRNSQIPTAVDCIWLWKKTIYSTQTGIPIPDNEIMSDQVKNVIQKWLDYQGKYPLKDSPKEYSDYAELCYPIDTDRSKFFQSISQGKKPSIGYKLLMLLNKIGMLQSIWTTNFDELAYNSAIISGVNPVDINLDSTGRIIRPQNKGELMIIKLHGDYRYGPLKNTDLELADQDVIFKQKMLDYLTDKHLIVAGYSGRDESIMESLKLAYSKPGGGRLYWCGYGREIPAPVLDLIDYARSNGRNAFYIPTDGFDNMLVSLVGICVNEMEEIKKEYTSLLETSKSVEETTPFSMEIPHFNTIIKSNLFEIEFPKEVFKFKFCFNEDEKRWATLREITKDSKAVAVPHERDVWALGTLSELTNLFGGRVEDKILRLPVIDWVPRKDTSLHRLFLTSILQVLSNNSNVDNNGKDIIWLKRFESQKMVGNVIYFTHKAIQLSFIFDGRRSYLSLMPTFYVTCEDELAIISKDIRTEIGRQYFENIWNKQFNDYINEWRKILFDISKPYYEFEYPLNSGSGFAFKIARNPAFGKIMFANSSNGVTLASNFPQGLIHFQGIKYNEPLLHFAPKQSSGMHMQTDFHPMKGLSLHRPYDHYSKTRISSENIQLGVICPKNESHVFSNFLKRIHSKIETTEKQRSYLVDFPGFLNAFGLAVNVPEVGTQDWLECQEPETKESLRETSLDLKNKIIRKIDELISDGIKKVIIICIPNRWLTYTSYDLEMEVYDLHDYVKAYCAEKSIATQFIQEETLADPLHCQINWWLSLSYFVKSLRIPWALDTLDKNTAFAGIGYSINRKRENQGIVLGCSHIYNAQGIGLKYRLSKVEDQLVWDRQDRPHLSYNDAYKFGLSIIDVFSSTMEKNPHRVVIHKRNYFMEEEKRGLVDSLKGNGINEVDLIEINFDDSSRFVSSKIINGQPEINGYPVTRGTCIIANKFEALLWTHGVVPALNKSSNSFYLGGRFIPGPLRIIKHYGKSNIGIIANEILALTKVDWNSFHMYTKLPATISSSNEIARIGKLLSKREGANYDYRFFI